MRFHFASTSLLFAVFSLTSTQVPLLAEERRIHFSREIRPILSENCFFCHGPDENKREAGLRLDIEADAKKNNDGVTAIIPGNPEGSALIERIVSTDPDEVMPPPKLHKVIPPAQLALLKEWIKQGAPWGGHWSYEKVRRPPVPDNRDARHAIDGFLKLRLDQEKLAFSPQAAPATLIRRVALDVTGLPPTLAELNRFLAAFADPASKPSAYEALVDYYLARPAYGEHWAHQWLDLARYADSAGYPSDPGREIWAYRDWVTSALNANMPFDRFTIEQLAGDMLPQPTDDQLIATAFHRNTMTQNEGGTDDEEFRTAAVIDRVNTTFSVWMGTTMACAQCHTHKYDPLTITEYFQFYDFLNQSADADKKDESPLHSFYTAELKEQRQRFDTELAELEKRFTNPDTKWLAGLPAWQKNFAGNLGWQQPKPTQVTAKSGDAAAIAEDSSIRFNQNHDNNVYTLELPLSGDQLSALRLETFPASGFGNFVLTEMKAEIVPPKNQPAPKARFVRIELPGKDKLLQLAEVQVFQGKENIARKGAARQSSLYADAAASRAIDGNTDGQYAKGSVSHTSGKEVDPWWEVDLKTAHSVDRVVVWNRADGVGERLNGFHIVLLDDKRQVLWKSPTTRAPEADKTFVTQGPVPVDFSVALADYEQNGFSAASVIRPKDKVNKGWAVAGAKDRPHTLTLLSPSPVRLSSGSSLRVTLKQESEFKKHTFGHFRVSYSGNPRVQQVLKTPAPVLAALNAPEASRSPEQTQAIRDYYVRQIAPETSAERKQFGALTKELAALKPVTVPIMKELAPKEQRVTHVQLRGNWQALGDVVKAATPAAFPAPPANAPRNRLTMAQWLVNRDNPLTARVTVNRLWESVFGYGIVRSSEEFGSQGELPVHPELLDWLAAEFMDSGWDLKHMLKLMLLTEAYRQTARTTPELNERDPDNRWLARGPRFRPTGELLRDQALAVSGLLSPKMYGKPVRPMRPNLGLNTAFGGNNDWVTSQGEDKHRRSLYTDTKRNSPYPSFTTFDATNREVCTVRRNRTNTPLQAFVTLNDPVYVEANQGLARRLLREGGSTPESRLSLAFRLCLSREPTDKEITALTHLFNESLTRYQADPKEATIFATDPIGPAPAGTSLPELAAWTTVANVIMNLDEFLMRK